MCLQYIVCMIANIKSLIFFFYLIPKTSLTSGSLMAIQEEHLLLGREGMGVWGCMWTIPDSPHESPRSVYESCAANGTHWGKEVWDWPSVC